MTLSNFLQKSTERFKPDKTVYDRVVTYFEKNEAARKYAEVCEEKKWEIIYDHLTVRTYDIDKAATEFEALEFKLEERIDYKNEGWYAKVYRHPIYGAMFIDQNYDDAPESKKIIKVWVDKFTDKDFHHIAFRLPEGVEIEEAIDALKKKGIEFPGSITGPKGSKLRQIFSKAEFLENVPFSVLELAERNKDPKTGKVYEGFINEQADSLMKDSILK